MQDKKQNTPPVENYEAVPSVPDGITFDDALAVHRKCIAALNFWKNKRDWAIRFTDKDYAVAKIRNWQQCQNKAAAVIQSHQLRMF